ncbi:tail sheath [Tenacibaculum phage PTm1]|uniref:Tail sheath n=2 Tax=Shirahamavirus PTm1 TaxID=2846435 RepID=A0A5S9BYY4_9CAUD|nr:tail sheath [Tenacibaculum phage PTm1]BBI90408.1 tail sheath [Tenacibaculum phage PTm1]BBI90717.1 tail sheath [Tenacibaculum phage PTm5]
MALDPQLAKFRAPGTKILTTVQEQIPIISAPNGARLLVINSRKGAVNKILYVQTWTEFKRYFGNISIAEERKGSFGHRSAYYMLQTAPIYVLNLRKFDDTKDKAGTVELSVDSSVKNASIVLEAYSKLFNKQQFWNIDPRKLVKSTNTDKLLMFANVGSDNLSIFVRKSRNVRTSLTFREWYKNLGRTMPSFVYPEDKVADWYVDVLLFENTFDNTSSANASYGHIFDISGNVKKTVVNELGQTVDALGQLASIPESGYVATITGNLIQGFISETGENHDVVSLINNNVQQYGLIAKVNDNIFDNAEVWTKGASVASNAQKQLIPVDLVGHRLFDINANSTFNSSAYTARTNVRAVSYTFPLAIQTIGQTLRETYTSSATVFGSVNSGTTLVKIDNVMTPATLAVSGTNHTYTKSSTNQIYVFEKNKVGVGEKFVSADGNLATATKVEYVGKLSQIADYGTMKAPVQPYNLDGGIAGSNNWDDASGNLAGFSYPATASGTPFPKDGTNSYYVYPTGHPLAGLPLVFRSTTGFVVHNPVQSEDTASQYIYQKDASGNDIKPNFASLPGGYAPNATRQYIEAVDIQPSRVKANDTANSTTKWTGLLNAFAGGGHNTYLVTFDKPLVFNNFDSDTTTVDASPYTTVNSDADSVLYFVDGTNRPVFNPVSRKAHSVYKSISFDAVTTGYAPVNLSAYVARNEQFVDGTATRQKEILDMLTGSSLRTALANRELSTFYYIVDSFKSYIEPNIKVQLKTIAKERQLCRAIYNMPSIRDFQDSTNPFFKETTDGEFQARFIPSGGNLQLPYTNTFSIPNEDGWYAYGFGPDLMIQDGGRTIYIPPAPVVSNNFQRKYQSGNPYDMVAGAGAGTVSGTGIVGVEYTFNEKNDGTGDRDYLNPFGFNIILNKRATGLQIYSNVTSLNTIETPLRSIHTSESLMYIQDQVNKLLERYVFKFNTAQNRLTIKTEADKICQRLVDDGVISNFVNQMDEKNNTSEVINARIGILDTTLYANNGMEIAIHRTKVDGVQNTTSFELL